jgi:hypothetical protein
MNVNWRQYEPTLEDILSDADDPAQSVKTLFESRDASLGFWIGLNGSDHRSAARATSGHAAALANPAR